MDSSPQAFLYLGPLAPPQTLGARPGPQLLSWFSLPGGLWPIRQPNSRVRISDLMALWVAKSFWEKNWKLTSPNILNRRPTEILTHWKVWTHQQGNCCAASSQMLLHIPKHLRALQSPSWVVHLSLLFRTTSRFSVLLFLLLVAGTA